MYYKYPCIFDAPVYNMEYNPVACHKQLYGQDLADLHNFFGGKVAKLQPQLKYKISDAGNNTVDLSISKDVNESVYNNEIKESLLKIKQAVYQEQFPSYKIVQDIFGNQYFVRHQSNEQELEKLVLQKFDIGSFNKKFATKAFQNYQIEVNEQGSEIKLSSNTDNVSQTFAISNIKDVEVTGFEIEENTTGSHGLSAVLNIRIHINPTKKAVPVKNETVPSEFDELTKLIRLTQQKAQDQADKTGESRRRKLQEEWEAKVKLQKEQKEEEQRKAQELRNQELKIQQQKAEENRKLQLQKKKQQMLRQQKLKRLAEQEKKAAFEAKRLAEENAKMMQEANRLAQQKAEAELEAQRLAKEREELELDASSTEKSKPTPNSNVIEQKKMLDELFQPKVIKINYNSDEEEEERTKEFNTPKRRSSSPPLLVEVEDEELNRYRASLNKSPKSDTAIVEDM